MTKSHSARYVTKDAYNECCNFSHANTRSHWAGHKNRILFMQELLESRQLDVDRVDGLIPIVKAYAGMHGGTFEALAESNIDGLVIEALGAGNLPPQTLPPLKITGETNPSRTSLPLFQRYCRTCLWLFWRRERTAGDGVIFCNSINSQKPESNC